MKVRTVNTENIAIEIVEVLAEHRLWICTAEKILECVKELLTAQNVAMPPKREPKQAQR